MSKIEDLVKWKTVETVTPNYPDGVIFIKEDTSVEFPLAMVAFPLGWHENGTKKQRESAGMVALPSHYCHLSSAVWLGQLPDGNQTGGT